MSFTFTANVPLSGQSLNITKNPINQNFQAINQWVQVNHIGFNLTDLGKHTTVEMQNQLAGDFTGTAGEGTAYTQAVSAESQLFFTPDATGNQYILSNTNVAAFATFAKVVTGAATIAGWTFLPGGTTGKGIIVNYGFEAQNLNGSTSGNVTFSRAYTNCYGIWAQPTYTGTAPSGGAAIGIDLPNGALSSFNWVGFSSSNKYDGFVWIAIGT